MKLFESSSLLCAAALALRSMAVCWAWTGPIVELQLFRWFFLPA